MEENSEYLKKMMGQLVEASGVPTCFICGSRITGMHIDYMDKDRIPRKICIGCVYKTVDYYLNAREERMKGEDK